jgi:hypothetical protein
MDDCSVVTREGELELYRQITREFFEILCENHLFLQPRKCLVEAEEMDFLGMRLNHHGITINPAKIKGLTDWPRELMSRLTTYKGSEDDKGHELEVTGWVLSKR